MRELPKNIKCHFQDRKANILDHEVYTQFAIFVPLIQRDGELQFIFQVRSKHIRQPGEISFPGGKVEQTDASIKNAAIRELSEELGVASENVQFLGELDYMVTSFRLMLFPFIGMLPIDTEFHINHDEVEEIFFVPVSALMKMTPKVHNIHLQVEPEENFPFHLIPNGQDYNWRKGVVKEQFYEYNGYIIWGLTARILTHVLDEMKSVLS